MVVDPYSRCDNPVKHLDYPRKHSRRAIYLHLVLIEHHAISVIAIHLGLDLSVYLYEKSEF